MATTKEDLQERAQFVRIHEPNCKIEHPTRDEANSRLAIMKRLGLQFALKEVRPVRIDGRLAGDLVRPASPNRSKVDCFDRANR